MATSFHTYPEYETDIRAAFDALATQSGLTYVAGNMPKYANAFVELQFGIELQTPELYITLKGHPKLTADMFWAAAGLPAYKPGKHATGREHAQARLSAWAQALSPLLPTLAQGDFSKLKLQSASEAADDQKLRTYVYDHAPITHIAREKLFDADWKKYAEAFVKEQKG